MTVSPPDRSLAIVDWGDGNSVTVTNDAGWLGSDVEAGIAIVPASVVLETEVLNDVKVGSKVKVVVAVPSEGERFDVEVAPDNDDESEVPSAFELSGQMI